MNKFLKERIAELHSITWPTRKQAIHAMITVIVIMLLVGVFLGVADYVLNQIILRII